MNKVLIVIGIGIGLLLIIGIIILNSQSKSKYKKSCSSDTDCIIGQCEYDPDYNKNVCTTGKYCNIDPDNLLECSPMDTDGCKMCINQPAYSCVVVDDKHPYKVKKDNKVIELPDSKKGKGWCLPPFEQSTTCNPVTADTILTKIKDKYQWSCLCKFPNLVKQNPEKDCDVEIACGSQLGDGKLLVPSDIQCTQKTDCDDTDICHENICYKPWEKNKNIDPTKGICDCIPGFKYVSKDDTTKTCVEDSCYPEGTTNDDGGCDCKPTYISCPGENILNPDAFCNTNNPICIKDPCHPGGEAHKKDGCLCKQEYIKVSDLTSVTLNRCKRACDENVCKDRGTCNVVGKDNDKKVECTCNLPYTNEGDTSMKCRKILPCQGVGKYCNKFKDCCQGLHCKKNKCIKI